MTTNTVQIPCDADHDKKPYVARISGRDPKKLYKREFLGISPYVTKPGVYEATERKDGRSYYAVVRTDAGDLTRVKIAPSLLAELVDGWLHRMDEVIADPNKTSGKLRDEAGNIRVRVAHNRSALMAERGRLVSRIEEIDNLLTTA